MDEPYIGLYTFTKPTILVRDPDLVEKILIEDFDSFRMNEWKVSEKTDPLLATHPYLLSDNDRKISRRTLTPVFTPNKVKCFEIKFYSIFPRPFLTEFCSQIKRHYSSDE